MNAACHPRPVCKYRLDGQAWEFCTAGVTLMLTPKRVEITFFRCDVDFVLLRDTLTAADILALTLLTAFIFIFRLT